MDKKTLVALTALALGVSQGAMAYQKGDFVIRAGAAKVAPHESSSNLDITKPDLGFVPGGKVQVDDNTQVGLTFSYFLQDKIAVELLAATPFNHDISGDESLAFAGKLASTRHLPPTLLVNYYFNAPDAKFQPYVGVGLNYTVFFDEEVDDTLDNAATFDLLATVANPAAAGAVTSIDNTELNLDDSWGMAIQVGFDYQITDQIGINAAYWKIDIDTEGEITTDSNIGRVKAEVDVQIDPSVYMLGMTYKF